MSSDDGRIGVDDLLAFAQPVSVDALDTDWPGNVWAGDVGARSVQSAVFGNLELVLTHGDVVLHGTDRVEAERFDQRDGGTVPCVDLAALGFSRGKAEAAVLAVRTHYDRDRPDLAQLAELVTTLADTEPEAVVASGFDGDAIDALLSAVDSLAEPIEFDPNDDSNYGGGGDTTRCPHCGEVFVAA